MMKSYKLTDKLAETQVRNEWEEIVGKTIAKNTRRLSIYKKTLYLEVMSAALRSDLYFHEKTIVEKVNQYVGQRIVEHIKIK
jgi:predicted nucleic acid-binding Zn ribbon protein